MPLTAKGKEILQHMEKEYGAKKGTSVFYASKNAGKISGVDAVVPAADPEPDSEYTRTSMFDAMVSACDKYNAKHDASMREEGIESDRRFQGQAETIGIGPMELITKSIDRYDSKFSTLVDKLDKKGESHKDATKVAAKVGRESIVAEAMAKRSAASRAKHKK
ncbi:MAG: hypothetical protein ACRESI_06550 [Gammaproteobacteria bacterium]